MTTGSVAREEYRKDRIIHVVVTCSDRKTRSPETSARARELRGESVAARMRSWQAALASHAEQYIPADDLYAGDHWQVVRSLAGSAPPGIDVRIWICSAGYGLISLNTPLAAYAATFDAAHPDAVAPSNANFGATEWWAALTRWPLAGATHRSITDVATRAIARNELLLVVLSRQYLAALVHDLQGAANIIGDRLLLLSTGTRAQSLRSSHPTAPSLADLLLPANSGLKALVGGAMQSLNARVARQALRAAHEWIEEPSNLHRLVTQWSAEAPVTRAANRSRSDDAAIRQYITAALRKNSSVSHSSLLHMLRSDGRACEQSRFRDLFREVVEKVLRSQASKAYSGIRT